ncbi:Gfo/Idh/MocA family oxidoreductase [Rhodobacteraceae bacterium]|nr:Gfo/Idh/MocA family oxidoreductase [Paracoccaceae bacterium]
MKYAIVGTGSRHQMFRGALTGDHAATNQLVGLCDSNPHRLARAADAVPAQDGNGIATYTAEEFDRMLAEQKPAAVVVTVPDDLHHEYIIRAMRAGCDVITEKPMTVDLPKLRAILQAQSETGRKITVSFNYRYTPARTQIKDLLMADTIGTVTAVDFTWYLDRVHGADYFRRWHREKARSGGLLVHKSTHHFDLVNWWLDATPVRIAADGTRAFYTPQTAARMGLEDHGTRCHTCPVAEKCDLRLDLAADPALREMYLEAEALDGYHRDQCVFDPSITIEDTMQVHAAYDTGAMLNYSLVAYSPWEGLEITFHGTKGNIVHRHTEVHGVFGGKRDHATGHEAITTQLHLAGEAPRMLDVWQGTGDHGGADPVMLGYMFDPDVAPDRYGRGSSHIDGGWSILSGIIANEAMARDTSLEVEAYLRENGIDLARPARSYA